MRVGIGYDIHRLVEGRKLILGGVEIPYVKGLLGHSDADVMLHAIADALLGAVGRGDIGEHFPDTDAEFCGASSLELLKKAKEIAGASINNVDAVLIVEEPKIAPFKEKMRSTIAEALGIAVERVSIKATTPEGIGPIGAGEAIAAYAVVCVE